MFFKFLRLIVIFFTDGWRAAMRLLKKFLADRRMRFIIVGGAASLTYFLLGLLFVDCLAMPVPVGNPLAYALSFAVSYLGQSLWTFEARGNHLKMLLRFGLTQLIGLAINFCIVGICVYYGMYYPFAMLVAICSVPVFVYLVCKYWVFRKEGKENGKSE